MTAVTIYMPVVFSKLVTCFFRLSQPGQLFQCVQILMGADRLAANAAMTHWRRQLCCHCLALDPTPLVLGQGSLVLTNTGRFCSLPPSATLRSFQRSTCLATVTLPCEPCRYVSFVFHVCEVLFLLLFINPKQEIMSLYVGNAAAAVRASLPSLSSVYVPVPKGGLSNIAPVQEADFFPTAQYEINFELNTCKR